MRAWWNVPTSSAPLIAAAMLLLANRSILSAQSILSIDDLIEHLGSPVAHVRDDAVQSLQRLGPTARNALRRARHHPLPEISNRASILLAHLPLYLPDDPPEVKAILFDYGIDDADGREQRISRLSTIRTTEARHALVRIARDEPVRVLQWKAVTSLARCDDPAVLATMRDCPDEKESCQLILAAWGWRGRDPARAMNLARRAIELDPAASSLLSDMATAH